MKPQNEYDINSCIAKIKIKIEPKQSKITFILIKQIKAKYSKVE